MASENGGEKMELGNDFNIVASVRKPKRDWVLLSLRLLAFLATASATLVMALNKQTKTFAVATSGTTPLKATLTAKFSHTPAFVFYVVANGNASLHNLVMVAMDLFVPKFHYKGLRLGLVAVLDMLVVALTSAGDGAATFMSELGKNGNSHARWNKICDKFEAYCHRGGISLIASFIGIILLQIITVISITKLQKLKRIE